MEWNKQLIEIGQNKITANFLFDFTMGIVKNYDFYEPDVSRFNSFESTGSISMH